MREIGLIKGEKYNVASLRLTGWTHGNGTGSEGYNWLDYFESDGTYKGADQDGIEPVVESLAQRFIVWADDRKAEARVVEASSTPDAIEQAEALFGVEAEAVNVIDESRRGEVEFYGVAHAE